MGTKQEQRIVIIGGGFAGLYTYKYLRRLLRGTPGVHVTLVSEHNYFLFTPLLHEVATGSLSMGSVVEPIRSVLDITSSDFCKGRVKRIVLSSRRVETSAGDLSYDYLVIALGSETNFHNCPGAAEHAFTLKTLADAVRLKNHIIAEFEAATHSSEEERRTRGGIVVIGGGPTGVELAAELAEFSSHTLVPTYCPERCAKPSITLLDHSARVLGRSDERMSAYAERVLEEQGVVVRTGVSVAEVSPEGVLLKNGERIRARTVVWVAGVRPRTPRFSSSTIVDGDGRIPVDALLRVRGYENVFALGDVAAVTDAHGVRVPDLAQSASKEAKITAHNIAAALTGTKQRVFTWRPSGDLVSLGHWRATGVVLGVFLSGPFAWWLWRTVYLFKMLSWQKRLKVAVEWTVNLFSRRDVSELPGS